MAGADIKQEVKNRYGAVATDRGSCCGSARRDAVARRAGYSDAELAAVPAGANMGLGCGNPLAFSSVREGETVLDLGSGAGIDCFLAAARVGKTGHVIGVDMTPEMLDKARAHAARGGYTNVEFRAGEIESLPIDDNSIDAVISNCVINLSPDKAAVFAEIERVLRPGGRFFISDIVLTAPLPDSIRSSLEAYAACLAGAMLKEEYLQAIGRAGLTDVRISNESTMPEEFLADADLAGIGGKLEPAAKEALAGAARSVVSIQVEGRKPAAA